MSLGWLNAPFLIGTVGFFYCYYRLRWPIMRRRYESYWWVWALGCVACLVLVDHGAYVAWGGGPK